ncbi:MAG TPA: MaoC/PaaZ C-terminal domain-containing protein [Polyangia bacterium]|nr:MaoC/PaaZ C-terminal domain-containing protein [Polyangia bacterium]
MALNRDLVGKKSDPLSFSYTWRDAILYALSVGAKDDELDYVFEQRGPKVLPTFAVVPSFNALVAVVGGLNLANPLKALHGEQKIICHRPIAPGGKLTTVAEIKGIYDKGKGGLVVVEAKTVDEKNEPVFDNVFSVFCVGEGGFGGDKQPEQAIPEPPAGQAPDFKVTEATAREQALLYRLNGDFNPLHADPQMARMVGYERPILHGLCTFGFAGRALLRSACGGDARKLRSFGARFAKPVLPGATLTTEGWQVAPGTYAVRVTTQEGTQVLTNGVAEVAS